MGEMSDERLMMVTDAHYDTDRKATTSEDWMERGDRIQVTLT